MKRPILYVVLTCLFASAPLSADTVMLFTSEAEGSRYFEIPGLDFAAAVEDGIMDFFFDAGHIVFNYGLPGKGGTETPFRAESVAVRAAKSGGASLLLEIELSEPGERIAPAEVRFSLTDVVLQRVLASGVVHSDEVDDGSITDPRALCAALGLAIARAALGE